MQSQYYLFDFDSTVIQTEGLEELAMIALEGHPEKEKRVAEIKRITNLGMEGKIPFHESLAQRIALFDAKKEHIGRLIETLKSKLSPTFLDNLSFFDASEGNVYVVSGGFREFIEPVVQELHISPTQVLANTFVFDDSGRIIGVDPANPLSREGGKIEVIRALGLVGNVIMVGDGMSDYDVWEGGLANEFYAFTETVKRPAVMEKAEKSVENFDELLIALASL